MMRHTTPAATRRSILAAGAAGAAAALAAPRLARAQARTLTSLRATSRSWLWMAEDYAIARGYFEQSGVRVTMAATERGVNQDALIAGATDVLLGAPTQNMRIQLRRQPVKMILGSVNKYASNIVVRRSAAERAGVTEASAVEAKGAALRGLKLGTTGVGAGPDQLIRFVMRKGGVAPDRDAQLVPIRGGGQAMLAALQQGQIDGFCLSSPTSDLAVQRFDAVYLFNMTTNPPPELADYLYITASVTERTIAEKGEALTAYCRGIALALRAIQADPAAFKAWSGPWLGGMEPSLFEASFANNLGIYMATPVPTAAHFAKNLEFLKDELSLVNQPPPPESYGFADAWDLRFVTEAMRGL